MRRMVIGVICGFMMFYTMSALSMELLVLEQQLSTLTGGLVSQHDASEIIKNMLIEQLKDSYYGHTTEALKRSEESLAISKRLYEASEGIPRHESDGHLDWSIWTKNGHIFPTSKEFNAIYTFCIYINTLYEFLSIKYKMQQDIVETPEFSELVKMLTIGIPADLAKTKRYLIDMWQQVKDQDFSQKYPDFVLWMEYFGSMDMHIKYIIFRTLGLNKNAAEQYDKAQDALIDVMHDKKINNIKYAKVIDTYLVQFHKKHAQFKSYFSITVYPPIASWFSN